MKMMLAENIRAFRKERSLTQEQLSEALGVTAGAVYKWEAKLSIPELELIIQMADFFDTSVDVLLGYEVKDNRLEATVKRLQEYRRSKDWDGLAEAEKALGKYPHSFPVVRECAVLYRAFGFESGDEALFRRALELLERSRLLLPQNTDPQISEQTLCGQMATTYLGLGETDKAVELWKAHNAGGLFSHDIGHTLAVSERTEEAVPFLSESMAKIVSELCDTIIGYINVFFTRGDLASAQAILQWGTELFAGLRKESKPNYLDRVSAAFSAALAGAQFLSGQGCEAHDTLKKAKELAASFDASPSYDESDIRFITRIEGASAHDDLGATAMDGVGHVVSQFENEEFTALWKQVKDEEENKHE
ncbi:MAG: helix-turn-helix transcriptional regulator [Erysipelotrichaceae bacterium]|nr:helix-turn-helix transcriptional regulator [Erysipelotrichaceae bacterium]